MKRRVLEYMGYGLGMLLLVSRDRDEASAPPKPDRSGPSPLPKPVPGAAAGGSDRKPRNPTNVLELARNTWKGFSGDECTTLGASVAYFSVFSLAPLLLTLISVAGLVLGREEIQNMVQSQIQSLVSADAAQQVQTMISRQTEDRSGGIAGAAMGFAALLFGATGAFAALQDALNKTWHVKPDPAAGGLKAFLMKRVLSFGMILAVVFLLIASLVISTILTAMGDSLGQFLPPALTGGVAHAITLIFSFVVIAALFAWILKVLPDGEITWRDALVGGLATSALFTIGKTAIGFYFAKAAPASVYGAAGSLVLLVLWLYYTSVIVLMGSEFTRA